MDPFLEGIMNRKPVKTEAKFIHEANQDHPGFKDRFAHRIVIESPMGRIEGEWTSYTGIARLSAGGQEFFAVTAYYEGNFPIEQVLAFHVPT